MGSTSQEWGKGKQALGPDDHPLVVDAFGAARSGNQTVGTDARIEGDHAQIHRDAAQLLPVGLPGRDALKHATKPRTPDPCAWDRSYVRESVPQH